MCLGRWRTAGTSIMTFRLVAVSPVAVTYFWVGVVPPVVEVVEPEPALPVVVVAPPVVVVAFVLVAPAPLPVYVAPPVLVEVEVVAPAPAPVLLVVEPLLLVVAPLLLVLLVVEFEVEPLPERPGVPDWIFTLGLELLVVASRLAEPTVVPGRTLLFGSERLVVAALRRPERSPAPDRTLLFGSERAVVAVESLAAGVLVVEPSSELPPTTAPVTPRTTPSTTPAAAPTGPVFGSF